jgi:membrane-associated phospholipid phosphatase
MIYPIIGLCLFFLGLSYKIIPLSHLDIGAVKVIQNQLGRSSLFKWFEYFWFFGRTFFTLIALLFLTAINWKLGLTALMVFGAIAALERGIKLIFDRSRPYSIEEDIKMLQPQQPSDPSFPSGDVLRAWFLALILSVAVGNSEVFLIISILLASLVSLGRMVFGVHYLTDVLGGTGLGFLGAGTTIWLWQILNII